MIAIDWDALVSLAKGSEQVPPQPEQLQTRLQAWSLDFERRHKKPPVIADFPDPVPQFFTWLVEWPGRGRPCSDQKMQAAASKAWTHCVLKDSHTFNSLMLACQFEWDGVPTPSLRGTPSEESMERLARETGAASGRPVSSETIRDILYPRGPRRPPK